MPNRLAAENSPYLLQHADNPVDWFPWGTEAFQRAQRDDKPIFLSVGYAACHWCHVMAHESFEDESVAALMNEHFVSIKVDREERPDVDAIYMDAVVNLTGQGGWPLSVFLTPEAKPFFGGTYFPPRPRYNMPSFSDLLKEIHRLWREDRDRLLKIGNQLVSHIAQATAAPSQDPSLEPVLLEQAVQSLFDRYDWHHGGWGGAPKFPQAAAIEFLLRTHANHHNALALEMASHALDAMASGGLYDQLGGGFHRYTVDANWEIPHFEKMLYDNASLMRVYLHGWQLTGDPRYLTVVENTYQFLQAAMRDPAGGYYASLDADTEGAEGRFYTWTLPEVRQVLGEGRLSDLAAEVFGLSEGGNFEGTNVLTFRRDLAQLAVARGEEPEAVADGLREIRQHLIRARSTRVPPAADDKIIASWNGLLLITLAETGFALDRADIIDSARELAGFLLDRMMVDGQFMRTWRLNQPGVPAFLEDYAAVGLGLLALYQVDFNIRWFEAAESFAGTIMERFLDPAGGFFDTAAGQKDLIYRPKSTQDSPYTSGNSMAVMLLLQLHALDGKPERYQAAEKAVKLMKHQFGAYPAAFAGWLNAFDFMATPPVQLALIGDTASREFHELLATTRGYNPQLVRGGGPPDSEQSPELLLDRVMMENRATAYVCRDFHCLLPTNSATTLARQLEDAGLRGSIE
jgi:uncharacterized protein YyaL (SSP411 family)